MPRLMAPAKRGGITRVELLLILVFALLGGGVLLAAAARASVAEARVLSRLNLKQLAIGTITFFLLRSSPCRSSWACWSRSKIDRHCLR